MSLLHKLQIFPMVKIFSPVQSKKYKMFTILHDYKHNQGYVEVSYNSLVEV